MARKDKNPPKRKFPIVSVIVIIVLIIIIVMMVGIIGAAKRSREDGGTTQENDVQTQQEPVQTLSLPYSLADGKLELVSVFQYSGINLDDSENEAENIGAIEITNCSGDYLVSAEITVVSAGGEQLKFEINNLPDGATVMAFETQSKILDSVSSVASASSQTQFTRETGDENRLETSVDDMTVTVRNISESTAEGVTVYYHCLYGGKYFGGKGFSHTIDSIEPGESSQFEADECLIGQAAVDRVTCR